MGEGLSHLEGTVSSPDAHALDKRLDALAATVCEHDPRTGEHGRRGRPVGLPVWPRRLCGR